MKKDCGMMKGFFVDALHIVLTFVVCFVLVLAVVLGLMDIGKWVRHTIQFRKAGLKEEIVLPNSGVGRVEQENFPLYGMKQETADGNTVLRIWCETDEDLPDWWNPDASEVVWMDSEAVSDVGGVGGKVEQKTSPNAAPVRDIGCPDPYWGERLCDSRGATAERWEIEEAIRELMLEAGGECEEDIREHAAVYCKRLLYTQTVGGYDDWGTTLHEVVYSHGFLETYPYIWDERANPTEEVREIWWDVWYNGYNSDFRVQNFRSGFYANWSIPAYNIGNTYYGINPWQNFSMFE